jgi:TatD DNase family protein
LEAQITITDTHTHFIRRDLIQDRNEMMQRAMDAGVSRFLFLQIDSVYTSHVRLRNNYPENVFLMMGLHPALCEGIIFLEELQCGGRTSQKRKFYAIA